MLITIKQLAQWCIHTCRLAYMKRHICQTGCVHHTLHHTHPSASSHTRQGSCESAVNDRIMFKTMFFFKIIGTQLTTALPHHHHNRFTALFPGPPRGAGARRELLDFMVQGKINTGRHTDHPAGRHSIRTNQCPPPPSPHIFYGPDAFPAAQPTVSMWIRITQKVVDGFSGNLRNV